MIDSGLKAKGLIAWSSSLKRLRKNVDIALREFFPELASEERREAIDLPADIRALLKDLAKAERDAERAIRKAAALRRRASQRLRSKLQLSVREVSDLMGACRISRAPAYR